MFGKKLDDISTRIETAPELPASDINIKISSPWVTYARKVHALFKDDTDINIIYNNDERALKLYVHGTDKAEAISMLLPTEKQFGNVTLKISVIPDNDGDKTRADLFRDAFKGNPVVADIQSVEPAENGKIDYIVFKKDVTQFYNDDLSTLNGFHSDLLENIAREVFDTNDEAIFFCTEVENTEIWP